MKLQFVFKFLINFAVDVTYLLIIYSIYLGTNYDIIYVDKYAHRNNNIHKTLYYRYLKF